MRMRLFLCLSLALTYGGMPVWCQFTDPHSYDNTPVDINQLELTYAFARANASIDTSLVISGARLNVNTGIIDYTRTFGLLHKVAWVEATLPLGGLNGSIANTRIAGSV